MDRDAVLLLGVEPNLRWRTFSGLIVDFARELERRAGRHARRAARRRPAHARRRRSPAARPTPTLIEQLGLQASRYEGPTGIVGVVHDACRRANIPSASLWAAVPHYVSLAPSPKAAAALCERLADLLGAEIDTAELDEAAEAYVRQVSEAIATDEETAAYVEELERRVDELDETDLPSGESLAAELSRFLREREEQRRSDGPGAVLGALGRALAEREGVGRDAGREAELEHGVVDRARRRRACRAGRRRRGRSAAGLPSTSTCTVPLPPRTR